MSLVTIERSSSSDNLSQISGEQVELEEDQTDGDISEDVFSRPRTMSSVEGFFASKGAAYAIPDGDFARKASLKGGELQSHLQGMVNLIRDEDTMRLVVKIESEADYVRYLCIVTTYGLSDEEESVILGFDWINDEVTLGLVIPLWNNVSTKLDGDGGFEIKTERRDYVFKPVSVQTLWTALLWIHKCLQAAHRAKHFDGGLSHAWLDYYLNRISSPRECINFWESMGELENRRDISFSYFDKVKTDEELLKGSIRNKLKEILTRFDLEEVTCRQVREALEAEMKMSLQHLKGYVDEQLFVILGQMESSSKITDHLYLGSEWNACNLQELKDNGIGYILNVTKEVDNFFPGTFEYMNIRIYDVKEADLLCHWGKTYRFIHKAKEQGCGTLVHCRRGISRSASTVIAYLMKENNMTLSDAMKFVKSQRSIVQPNSGFWKQLIIYEGILKSSRNRHNSLFRRRSNSDSTNARKLPKKGRHKNDTTDHVDSTQEHAHTLPRMANDALPRDEAGGLTDEVPPRQVPSDDEPLESNSSDDESSNSDDDLSKTKPQIRRTVSEPVIMKTNDVMLTSPTSGKPRARTFVDREASDVVRSPTRIPEDEGSADAIWMERVKQGGEETLGDVSEVLNQETEAEISVVDEPADTSDERPCPLEEKLENVASECPEADDPADESVVDTTNAEELTNTGEVEVAELSSDPTQVPCELSPRVDSPREESPREDNSDYETSPRTPRQRSRSIGEKLVDKLLVKQGRCESLDSLKKVNSRGRVRRRERKAKSDLQLSSSGFVKRHTQIIEEQMLYSILMNSEKTPATLSHDFWENNSDFIGKERPCEAQNSEKNEEVGLGSECVVTMVTDSEKRYAEQSDISATVSENNSENFEQPNSEIDCLKSSEKECSSEKDAEQFSQGQVVNNGEGTLAQSCSKNSPNNSENCSEKKRAVRPASQELQDIVQEVNAEAKRDIETQADGTRPLIGSQSELRHTGAGDDVCIDPMTWIDLTQHHGDVVKRRSAAFENTAAKGEPCAWKQAAKGTSSQSDVPSREDHEASTRQGHADDTRSSEAGPTISTDVPKLDLGELARDERLGARSNSIIVEDYNSWESSSVRDRTRILENIIARTGGSFPSPRSRVRQSKRDDSEVEAQLQQEMRVLDIDFNPDEGSSSEENRAASSSPGTTSEQAAERDMFGDEPVRSLVDKFEGKNGGSE